MIKRRPELDTENPPGQIINRPPSSHMEKPLNKLIDDFIMDSEEMFSPERVTCVSCGNKYYPSEKPSDCLVCK